MGDGRRRGSSDEVEILSRRLSLFGGCRCYADGNDYTISVRSGAVTRLRAHTFSSAGFVANEFHPPL